MPRLVSQRWLASSFVPIQPSSVLHTPSPELQNPINDVVLPAKHSFRATGVDIGEERLIQCRGFHHPTRRQLVDHRVVPTNRKVRCKAPSHVGDSGERIVSNFAGGKRVCGGTEDRRKEAMHPPWKLGTASIDRGLIAARKSYKCNETSPFCNKHTIAGVQLTFKLIAVEWETNRQPLKQNQANRK